jgi:hypothetical protein
MGSDSLDGNILVTRDGLFLHDARSLSALDLRLGVYRIHMVFYIA